MPVTIISITNAAVSAIRVVLSVLVIVLITTLKPVIILVRHRRHGLRLHYSL